MTENLKILKQGAEAKLYICNYLGRPTIIKERFKKNYRHPDLDTNITKERMRNEIRAIMRCQCFRIKTPALYLVDFERRRIYMEHFTNSITVKDFIINFIKNEDSETMDKLDKLAKTIGHTIKELHEYNIIHGDLTTSNMLLVHKTKIGDNDESKWLNLKDTEFVMIDFGLTRTDSSVEDKAVDLYVLERALLSTHNEFPDLFSNIIYHYMITGNIHIKEILQKLDEVRARGRKRTMEG